MPGGWARRGGLASVHEEASADARTATITEVGTVMGTPGYMAPEQVKGRQAVATGYANYEWLHVDPDFEPMWDDREFQEIVRPKG